VQQHDEFTVDWPGCDCREGQTLVRERQLLHGERAYRQYVRSATIYDHFDMTNPLRGRPAHRTTPAEGEETKATLLAVAREMFARSGYSDVAMGDICARAHVSRGALYHHFPGKDGLFLAVCEQVAADATTRVAAAAAQAKSDAWSRLVAGCRAFLEVSTEDDVRQILLTDAPSVLGWAQLRELDSRHGLGLVKLGIQRGIDEGTIQSGPVDTLAHMLVGALNEAAMLIGRSPNPNATRDDAMVAVNRILDGIAGKRQRPNRFAR
jgi:AcrR family transcriptional regulator